MTALTHKENDLHNRLIMAEFYLAQAEKELRRLHEENEVLRARLVQPEPEADVCCQDFRNCLRSCTPRGQWIAHVRCGCGDQIMPDDGAECGTCVTARNVVKPEQEPVGWFMEGTFEDGTPSFTQVCETDPEFYVPLYTAPPQREWQGLTTQEIADETDIATSSNKDIFDLRKAFWCGARWAEDKLKEKNT